MARLGFPDYLQHIRNESRRFREALASCDPAAPVPGCPDWDAADLVWHLAGVQRFWATTIRTRPASPQEEGSERPERPETYAGLLSYFRDSSASLVSQLESADPGEAAWSWAEEQTVGFTFRRQAHEALIHRIDAEQTAGREVTPPDPALASDGVEEVLDVIFGGCPPWGSFAPLPHFVRVDLSDTGESLWIQLGRLTGTDPRDGVGYDEDDIRVVQDPGTDADAVLRGPAAALDAWLWRRGDDAEIHVSGDREIYDRFRGALDQPIT